MTLAPRRLAGEARRLLAAYTDDELVTLMQALVTELRPDDQGRLRVAIPARPDTWSRRLWLRQAPEVAA